MTDNNLKNASMEVAVMNDEQNISSKALPSIEQYENRFTMLKAGEDGIDGEVLQLYYIPVTQAILWDSNAKLHSIPAIIDSIKEYGFRDPPSWDEKLGGIIEGNGRVTALTQMYKAGGKPPRGIPTLKETGEWCVPIIFGLDAVNKSNAVRYAIDHNNLTMAGGDFTAYDMSRMWNHDGYHEILAAIREEGTPLASMNLNEIGLFLDGFEFDPIEDMTGNADDDGDEMPDEKDEEENKITIEFSDIDYIDVASEAIIALLEEHPEWGAKIA